MVYLCLTQNRARKNYVANKRCLLELMLVHWLLNESISVVVSQSHLHALVVHYGWHNCLLAHFHQVILQTLFYFVFNFALAEADSAI